MIRPINVGETREYICKGDTESPTVWIIGILDSLLKSKLTDLAVTYRYNPDAPADSLAESKLNIAEQDLEFVRFGLKGVKNFIGKDGNEVKFQTVKRRISQTEYDIVSDDTMKVIPRYVIRELANVIAAENKITEDERKN